MKIVRYNRLGPDLSTRWGNYTSPHVSYTPEEYRYQQPAVPWLVRGQAPTLPPSLMGNYLADSGASTPVAATVLASPCTNTAEKIVLSGLGLLLLLGAAGLIGYLIGASQSKTRRNAPTPADVLPAAPQSNPGRNRRLSRYATSRRRDRHGRFVRG